METPQRPLITDVIYYRSTEGIRAFVSEDVRDLVSKEIWTKINVVESLWQRDVVNSVINNMEFRM